MTTEEIEYHRRFWRLGRASVPWLYPRYTLHEWRLFNLLPSFGIVENRGFPVRYTRKLFGIRLPDVYREIVVPPRLIS